MMPNSYEGVIGVFISYSHQDRLTAEMFARRLSDLGFKPWVDFDGIMGGDVWKRSIERALAESAVLMVLLTPEAVTSEWVRYEVKRALANGRRIIPLMIRTCELPEELAEVQYIDFRQHTDQAFTLLHRALLRAIVGTSSTPRGEASGETSDPFGPPELPAIRGVLAAAAKQEANPQPLVLPPAPKPLALVIEDSEDTQRFLREVLIDLGMDVHVAATRSQVTDMIRKYQYSFITLDMNLDANSDNGQDGILLMGNLKRYQVNVPVVIISYVDWSWEQVREFLVKHGIKDVLPKRPFIDTEELRAIVIKNVPNVGEAHRDS